MDRVHPLIIPLQVEFDSPKALLEKKDGMLKALVDESNDRAILYEMAERKKNIT